MSERLSISLITEGTYPFEGGGVSTWCDILCRDLQECDFHITAITGLPYGSPKYQLPPNVRSVLQVPLWSLEEPSEFIRPDEAFADMYMRRKETTEEAVHAYFLPAFRIFLESLAFPLSDTNSSAYSLHRLYRYFKRYEYKATFRSNTVWQFFKGFLGDAWSRGAFREFERPSLEDSVNCLRWLYNYLLPLSGVLPKTDVTHCTLAGVSGLLGVVAKLEYATPLLVTDHGVFIRERYIAIGREKMTLFSKRFIMNLSLIATRVVYEFSDIVSPVCEYNKRWELKFGADESRLHTIYNGIDPLRFAPKEKPEQTQGRPTVVAAARVFPLKDIETMIRACAVASQKIPNVHFIVYGPYDVDIPYTERCMRLRAELKMESSFTFAGFHSKPNELYSEGDISILTSISEGFPYTVIESMSCGRPVVATDVGGVREALEGFGVLARPRDPVQLGEGVVALLENNELRQRLGRLARESVILRFRTDQCTQKYLETYRRLAERKTFSLTSSSSFLASEQQMEMIKGEFTPLNENRREKEVPSEKEIPVLPKRSESSINLILPDMEERTKPNLLPKETPPPSPEEKEMGLPPAQIKMSPSGVRRVVERVENTLATPRENLSAGKLPVKSGDEKKINDQNLTKGTETTTEMKNPERRRGFTKTKVSFWR